MGLFDFIKDAMHPHDKVNESAVQQALAADMQKAGLSIQNFQVRYEKGLATISGQATTQKDLELARLLIGNHKNVEKVNDDGLTVAAYPAGKGVPSTPLVLAPQHADGKPSQMVTVQKGDTLSKIAQKYLGNANRYPEIFDANRPMLKDPDAIFPGQILRIPSELSAQAH